MKRVAEPRRSFFLLAESFRPVSEVQGIHPGVALGEGMAVVQSAAAATTRGTNRPLAVGAIRTTWRLWSGPKLTWMGWSGA